MKTLDDAVKIINGSPYCAMGLAAAERGVKRMVTTKINEFQFSALVSFLISIGSKAFRESQVLKATNRKQPLVAAAHFAEYIYDPQGNEDKHLVTRRNKERRLYTTMTLPVNNGKTQGVVE